MIFKTEAEYREQVRKTLSLVEDAFEGVDPDLAECDQALGALTITLSDQSRCILSSQPSVQQVWLALASKGTAYHFNFDPSSGLWKDDKNRGIELLAFLENYLKEAVGPSFRLSR